MLTLHLLTPHRASRPLYAYRRAQSVRKAFLVSGETRKDQIPPYRSGFPPDRDREEPGVSTLARGSEIVHVCWGDHASVLSDPVRSYLLEPWTEDSRLFLRLMKKIKDVRERLLTDPLAMPSWIYVAPSSVPAVVSALDYWPKVAPNKTVKGILKHHECKSPLDLRDSFLDTPGVSAAYKERAKLLGAGPSSRSRQSWKVLPTRTSKPRGCHNVRGPEVHQVDEFLNQQGVGGNGGPNIFEKEMDWYKEMNCFYPPKELERRNPGLVALKKQVMEQEARGEHSNPDKEVVYVVRVFLQFASFYELGSCAACLRMFFEYIRPIRNIMRLGRPTSHYL